MGRPSHRVCAHDTDRFAWGKKNTHTHTHIHTERKKERKKDRRQKSNRKKINSAIHQRWRWSLTYQMTAGRFSWSCLSFHFQMTIQSTLDSNSPPSPLSLPTASKLIGSSQSKPANFLVAASVAFVASVPHLHNDADYHQVNAIPSKKLSTDLPGWQHATRHLIFFSKLSNINNHKFIETIRFKYLE